MSKKLCIHCYVSGKVQGVWFRASTQEEAKRLNLTGWVRNLPDGRVEVLACGSEEEIKQLQVWLAHGPRLAQVTGLLLEEQPYEAYERFDVL